MQPRVLSQRYGLLLVSTMSLMAVQGMAPPGDAQQVLVTLLAGVSLLLAFRAADITARRMRIAIVVSAVALAASILHLTLEGVVGAGAPQIMNAAVVALGPPAIALGLVRNLRATGRVRISDIMGVLSLYIMLGMLFGFVYNAIDTLGADPFFAGGQVMTASHAIYFSFTTLTTAGYGDFTARTDVGHTLSVFEALLGQIYLVTVVSLLVSNLRPAAREG